MSENVYYDYVSIYRSRHMNIPTYGMHCMHPYTHKYILYSYAYNMTTISYFSTMKRE